MMFMYTNYWDQCGA